MRLPLAYTKKEQMRDLISTLRDVFDTQLRAGKKPSADVTEVTLPAVFEDGQVSSWAPKSEKCIAQFVSYKHDRPFATLLFYYKPESGPEFHIGTMAGWSKAGGEAEMMEHYEVFNEVLSQLGATPDTYIIKCPCGACQRVDGKYAGVSNWLNDHYEDEDVHPGRVSTTTLVKRQVLIPDGEDKAGSADRQVSPSSHS